MYTVGGNMYHLGVDLKKSIITVCTLLRVYVVIIKIYICCRENTQGLSLLFVDDDESWK